MTGLTPPYLRPGDQVAIVAPSRKISSDAIDQAAKVISSWGYQVQLGEHLYAEDNQFAGSDQQRLEDFNAAIRNPDIKGIFSARGGYGATRIIDGLDLVALRQNPKWIIGYSDATAIHGHIFQKTGIQTIHGSMPINFITNTDSALESLGALLSGNEVEYPRPAHDLNISGMAEAEMVGGNLSVIFSLLGSPSQLDTQGKILFLEDLDEYLYHIDRMMLGLGRAGLLSDLAGLVVGGMSDMRDNPTPFGKTAEEIIYSHAKNRGYPVCFGFPSGHFPNNLAWVHGKKRRLVVGDNQP